MHDGSCAGRELSRVLGFKRVSVDVGLFGAAFGRQAYEECQLDARQVLCWSHYSAFPDIAR